MNFSIIKYGASARCRIGAIVLLAVAACSRGGEVSERRAAPTPAAAAGVAEVIGALKLVRQEYANAVSVDGTVTDATEYAETELFAEQADAKFATLMGGSGAPEAARAAAIRNGITRTRAAIARHAPPAEVTSEASRTVALVEELLAGAVPEEIRGVVLATARADQALAAEEVVGEYRVGVTSGPARPIFHRRDDELVFAAPDPGSVYLGVLLRERRTKRFLPAAQVTAVLDQAGKQTEVALAELWGDFHQYGANVVLPGDGPLTITVRASPPAYARHGDMLTHFVSPVAATIPAHVQQGGLRFDARPLQPSDADYTIGDDVLQARTEAGELQDTGAYRIGLIVEGPEPIWTWNDGAAVLVPVAADATNHVEVVLLDRETGQLVPDARVTLTFLAGERVLGSASLHPLLSIFSHYGATLALPSSVTTVRVHVDPPQLGALDRPRLESSAEITLPLPPRRGGHM